MKVDKTEIEGLLVIWPDVYMDGRGYFYEAYNLNRYSNTLVNANFVQDNISKSRKNTVRGLHFQKGNSAQGKLCHVILGKVLDVAVDIRKKSPTFGKHFSIELSEENHIQLWIPPGFAHGFSVLSEEAIFHYKCTNFYSKENERTILYNDPALGINWKVKTPVVSDKDLKGERLTEMFE